MVERKFRVEDALNATKAAAEEGIVPGGGMALFNAVTAVAAKMDAHTGAPVDPEELAGSKAVLKACLAPLRRIVENAGGSADVILNELPKVQNTLRRDGDPLNWGYNAATGEYVDLVAAGVVDPVKVTRTALKNAASVAITFLSLDAVVYDEQVEVGPNAG